MRGFEETKLKKMLEGVEKMPPRKKKTLNAKAVLCAKTVFPIRLNINFCTQQLKNSGQQAEEEEEIEGCEVEEQSTQEERSE